MQTPRLLTTLLLSGALIAPQALALPEGGQPGAGGSISQSGDSTTITQTSQHLAIDWNSFSIAANQAVRFNQPNAAAIALNRITGTGRSEIYGSLSANGQIFILNPNGILFGRGAQVNVGGLVATTLSLDNSDFMAGHYRFSNKGNAGSLHNQGELVAADGGYIALLAPEVRNGGAIRTPSGSALLAAGDQITLTLNQGSLLGYRIDRGALDALVENRQLIQADGGQVTLSARAANALSSAAVNNSGVIEARTAHNRSGTITLLGDMQSGHLTLSGTLDASAPDGGEGGYIDTSAAHVHIANDARVRTLSRYGHNGNWLIDPLDYTIAASGGDITGSALGANLELGNITITNAAGAGNGDIFVNDAVSWSANTSLTLNASRHVKVNANITATGNSAGLNLTPGAGGAYSLNNGAVITLSGSSPSLSIAGFAYTVINNLGVPGDVSTTTLQGMKNNLGGRYALGNNIDATPTSGWNAGTGFLPIGTAATQFTGTFDGLGHSISNLFINRPATDYVGLFGNVGAAGVVQNVGLAGGSVTGNNFTSGLVAWLSGAVSKSYNTGSVNGSSVVGGLVGAGFGPVSNSYATGSVTGASYVGGLEGYSFSAVSNSYATGNVNGASYVGGLEGLSFGALGNSYATGNVNGNDRVGGLVGQNFNAISNSYATGNVSGTSFVGGLVGLNASTVTTSFWDTTTSGQATSAGGTGLTSAQMMTRANFTSATAANGNVNPGWDFSTPIWVSYDGHTTPLLASFLKPLTVTTNTKATVYSGTTPSAAAAGVSYSDSTALASGRVYGAAPYSTAINTGAYAPVQGYWSDQRGYNIAWVNNGSLSITPAALTVSANAAGKTYDGQSYHGGNGVVYSGFVNGETTAVLSGSIGYSGTSQGAINAGNYLITPGGVASSNYAITPVSGALSVTPAPLTISANSFSKYYDDIAYRGGNGVVYSGFVNGETPAVLSGSIGYGGASQGAINAGNHLITPGGVTSTNYAISPVSGTLTIKPANQTAKALGGATLEVAYNAAQNSIRAVDKQAPPGGNASPARLAADRSGISSRAPNNSRIDIVNCGVRMPAGVPAYTCE